MAGKRRYRRKRSNVIQQVKKYMFNKAETKFYTSQWTGVNVGTYASVAFVSNTLNPIGVGVNQNDRIGNKVTVTGLYGRLSITGADATNIVRIIGYISKDADDILGSTDALEFNDPLDLDKFIPLFDIIVNTTANGNNQKTVTIRKNFHRGNRKGIVCTWDGGTSGSYVNNRMSLYCVSDSSASSHPKLNGFIQTYFKDF